MSRTVILLSGIDVGGAQRFCLNLAKYLNSISYDYEVVFLRKRKSDALYQEFLRNKIRFTELNARFVSTSLPRLISYLRRVKPKVMLSSIGNVDFVATIGKLFCHRTKLIIRKANVVFDGQRGLPNRMKLKLEALLCYRMIALTHDMQRDYQKYGFKEKKTIVINNMVDIEYIATRSLEIQNPHEWFKNKEGPILIANARMVPEKRYDVLIEAFTILAREDKSIKLMILGDGELRDDIENMVPSSLKDRISFLGFQDNPYYYMSRSDVFLLSSDYEGFPNVIIEAFACGLPVVATNCKTGPREIIDNGVDGWVVEKGNPAALAEGVRKVLENESVYLRYSKKAKQKAKKYRTENIAQQYVKLFDDTRR